jgi:acetoin utilization deacetylase AcuC-like enzyme
MATALVTHPDCLEHDTGPGHPERPDRLREVHAALDIALFPNLLRVEAGCASPQDLMRVHNQDYVERILKFRPDPDKLIALDADTMVSTGSVEAALRAAGAAIEAVDLVMRGDASSVFVATRPPGHHAEPGRAMGFCLFNNVAVAAHHARAKWGLKRIAVADFDVHHGNGTQTAFWDEPELFFASSHQSPCYPDTGFPEERGIANNIANVPLPPGSGSAEFRRAWSETLLPAIDKFGPELLIISAGFDAHRADPLAQLNLEAEDFTWITDELAKLALRHCSGRVVSMLEGGYDLDALAACTAAHVAALERCSVE